MTFTEMYDLTPRSFFNAVNGFRKKEDAQSKERWIIARELMFATMAPYLEKGVEKQNILPFEWEQKLLKEMSQKKLEKLEVEIEETKSFWERQDNAKGVS